MTEQATPTLTSSTKKEIEIISEALILLTAFQKECEENEGLVNMYQFIKSNSANADPYYSIFRNLNKAGFFQNSGTRRHPIYTDFTNVDRYEIRLALEAYKERYRERNAQSKLTETVGKEEMKEIEFPEILENANPPSQQSSTGSKIMKQPTEPKKRSSKNEKKSLVVKFLGFTIYEKIYK